MRTACHLQWVILRENTNYGGLGRLQLNLSASACLLTESNPQSLKRYPLLNLPAARNVGKYRYCNLRITKVSIKECAHPYSQCAWLLSPQTPPQASNTQAGICGVGPPVSNKYSINPGQSFSSDIRFWTKFNENRPFFLQTNGSQHYLHENTSNLSIS